MKERESLARAVKSIAWGFLLLHLHFNLGTLDILPDWLGMVLILWALPELAKHTASAGLLRPFAILLSLWEGVEWLFALFGTTLDLGFLGIIGSIVALYFRFQLLTEVARIAGKFNCPQERSMLVLRNVDAVMITLFALPIPWDKLEVLAFLLIILEVIVALWIGGKLFSLSRSLAETDPGFESVWDNH